MEKARTGRVSQDFRDEPGYEWANHGHPHQQGPEPVKPARYRLRQVDTIGSAISGVGISGR